MCVCVCVCVCVYVCVTTAEIRFVNHTAVLVIYAYRYAYRYAYGLESMRALYSSPLNKRSVVPVAARHKTKSVCNTLLTLSKKKNSCTSCCATQKLPRRQSNLISLSSGCVCMRVCVLRVCVHARVCMLLCVYACACVCMHMEREGE